MNVYPREGAYFLWYIYFWCSYLRRGELFLSRKLFKWVLNTDSQPIYLAMIHGQYRATAIVVTAPNFPTKTHKRLGRQSRFEVLFNGAVPFPKGLYILLGSTNTVLITTFRNSKNFDFYTTLKYAKIAPEIVSFASFVRLFFFNFLIKFAQ